MEIFDLFRALVVAGAVGVFILLFVNADTIAGVWASQLRYLPKDLIPQESLAWFVRLFSFFMCGSLTVLALIAMLA